MHQKEVFYKFPEKYRNAFILWNEIGTCPQEEAQ